jgi:hypothetical protein
MPSARRAAVLGCAAAVMLLAAAYLVVDVSFLSSATPTASPRNDGFLRPLASAPVVAGNKDDSGGGGVSGRDWSPRPGSGGDRMSHDSSRGSGDHLASAGDVLGTTTTEPGKSDDDDGETSNVKSMRSCSFEATINLKRAADRLRERWDLPQPPSGSDGRPGRKASAWHRDLVDGLAVGFRSLCLARLDARSGRTAVVNYAVVLPKAAAMAAPAAANNNTASPPPGGGRLFPVVYVLHARDGAFVRSAGTDLRPNVADVVVDYLAAMSLGQLPQLVLVLPFSKACSLWADYEGGWVPVVWVGGYRAGGHTK